MQCRVWNLISKTWVKTVHCPKDTIKHGPKDTIQTIQWLNMTICVMYNESVESKMKDM